MLKTCQIVQTGLCLPRYGVALHRMITTAGGLDNPNQEQHQASVRPVVKDFKSLCAWKSTNELVDILHKNVVYYEPESDKSGLVVINKPYGLAAHKAEDSSFCLDDCLGSLASKLEVEKLEIVKCAERFSSGITILGTSKITQTSYKNSMDKGLTRRALSTSYLAMVKGQPSIRTMESVDRIMTDCPGVNKPLFGSMHKEPVLSRKLLKHGVNRNNVKRVHVAINSLARSAQGAGVVELSPSNTGKHFIPVYLADIGNPLLGDQMYDYRARTILGQRVKLSTAHTNAKRTQVLPTHLLELLGMSKGEEWMMPKMLHQHRIFLPDWLGRDKSLTVFAPPPPHWLKTCKVLGINFDFKEVAQKDTVKHWAARVRSKKNTPATEIEIDQESSNTESDLSRHVSELT